MGKDYNFHSANKTWGLELWIDFLEADLDHRASCNFSLQNPVSFLSTPHARHTNFQLGCSKSYAGTSLTHQCHLSPMPLLKKHIHSLSFWMDRAQSPEFSPTAREAFLDSASTHPQQTLSSSKVESQFNSPSRSWGPGWKELSALPDISVYRSPALITTTVFRTDLSQT